MGSHSAPRFNLDFNGNAYELREAEFSGILFEIVATLVFEKLVDRATYALAVGERELTGSGSSHFDPLCVSLYRHLKEQRYHGPSYPELEGDIQSFHLHSIKDGLVAVAFFLKGGDCVPHFIAGQPGRDVLTVLDRGARTSLTVDDEDLLRRLMELVPN
jgi:hypothetical protein